MDGAPVEDYVYSLRLFYSVQLFNSIESKDSHLFYKI